MKLQRAPLGGLSKPRAVLGHWQSRPTRKRCVCIVAGVKEIFMPALSSTMTEGKIVSWLKSPGEKVSKGESVVCPSDPYSVLRLTVSAQQG